MTKRVEIKIGLEKFLRTLEGKPGVGIVRDHRKRAVLIPEAMVNLERIATSGRCLADFGRRIRVYSEDLEQEQIYLVPTELCTISREDPAAVDGVVLPFGTIVNDHGLWLRHAAGFRHLGVNDRDDVLVRRDASVANDPSIGPVRNSVNTHVVGRAKRFVARLKREEHEADLAEADAWLRALAALGERKVLKAEFKCAGVDCSHIGNVPHLHRTTQMNFFDVRDSEMLRIASLLRNRFHKLRRETPRITVYSLFGVPKDQIAHAAFLKKLKSMKKDAAKLGIPAKLSDSRFYDPASKGIVTASFLHFVPVAKLPQEVAVITVNTDSHSEIKNHGVLAPLTAIMSLIDVLSAHAGVAVLNKKGTATTFTGPTGTGKTTAGVFWADRNEKYKRLELRRRYEMDLRRTPDAGRLGESGIQKELDRIMSRVGILCQEGWIEILKEGAGHWLFWPTEKTMYARTSGFPGLRLILSENDPLLENVAADYGGSGDPSSLGGVTHEYFRERIFYSPDWNHLQYDRSPRMISANVFLERNSALDFLVKRVSAREAIEWLIQGRTPDGRFEPLYNAHTDFSGLLMQLGVVGEKLVAAYDRALKGDFAPLGAGDEKLGQAVFEKFDVQVKLWLDNCRETPTYVVNGARGLELTQDVNWLLSEHPTAFGDWKHVRIEEFQKYMTDRYGVTYGHRGEWTHIQAVDRRR